MTTSAIATQPQAVLAFDSLAESYDDLFTRSSIGRAQRDVVWQTLAMTFAPGSYVLELNCGTGEDAIFLSRRGVSVFACDASERMVRIARSRVLREAPGAAVHVEPLPTEHLSRLQPPRTFDGVFSNFSGLNCVADLRETAQQLALLLAPGAPLLICLSTRFCLFEIVWFILRGQFRKALRRTSGRAVAYVGGFPVALQYPTVRELRRLFSPWFSLRSCTGVGISVPPSFAEKWACGHPRILNSLRAIDRRICRWPVLRAIGDHVLLSFERVSS
jgi:SAM-dependent methyltransferase